MVDKELSLEELLAQHEALAAKIAEIKSTKKAEVITAIKAQIKAYDITVTDLFDWQQEAPKRGRKPAGEAVGTKEKLPPKFRSSVDPSLTWSGRGKTPAWVKLYKDQGGNLNDWLIKD